MMRLAVWTVASALLVSPAADAADEPTPLMQARELYNERQFEAAIEAAEQARTDATIADRADLIAARAYLERYRRSAVAEDLAQARERLRRLNPQGLDDRERTEFVVGLGQALYFEESYRAAAEVFDSILDGSDILTLDSRERVLDWWATAIDRDAWRQPQEARRAAYARILDRMRDELSVRPGSATAGYWLAAAARSQGDLQAAWDAAEAGWVRSTLALDRGAVLRAELDQLMLVAIVPERARALEQPADELLLDWENFKERWKAN
jgi:hypothetical protein